LGAVKLRVQLWVSGSSNAGPNAAGRESGGRFRGRRVADVDVSWPGEERVLL